MPKFDLVLFDLDDTLIDSGKSSEYSLFMACKRYNIPYNKKVFRLYHEIEIVYWKAYERGELTQQEVLERRFDEFLVKMNITHVTGKDMNRCHNDYMSSASFLNDGALEVCKKLSEFCTLGIVSNGMYDMQKNRLAAAGLIGYISEIIVSESVGHPKPMKEFFDYTFECFSSFTRKQAIVVGDSLTADITGAINANVTSCWYNPAGLELPHDIHPKYEIANLLDLVDIVIPNDDNPLIIGF